MLDVEHHLDTFLNVAGIRAGLGRLGDVGMVWPKCSADVVVAKYFLSRHVGETSTQDATVVEPCPPLMVELVMRGIAIAVAILIGLIAPARAQKAEIDAVNAKWMDFFNKGDFASLALLFVIFDGDDTTDEGSERQDHPGRAPTIVVMTPR